MTTKKTKTFKKLNNQLKFFTDHRWWVWIMLSLVFFFGLAGRLYDLNDIPLDFHPTRQLHSMLIARGMYYENLPDAPDWKSSLAVTQWKAEGQIEPPIMERLSAIGYRLVGSDDLRIPRLLSIFFWTLGGIGLFLLLKDITGDVSAVVGMAYYMVLPYTLYASRSFQPEPLMTAAIIWAWWGVVRWIREKTWKNAIIAGLLSGFALFVKLPALFFVAPAWIGMIFSDNNFKKNIINRKIWLISALAVLPFLIYHIIGIYISGFLQSQTGLRFFPNLWIDPFHYFRWTVSINNTLGVEFFLIAFIGTLLIRNKPIRYMFFSVFIGYFFYGMLFSYHITSHDYYQIPLTPAVAVGLAVATNALITNVKGKKLYFLLILGSVIFFWMSFNFTTGIAELKRNQYHQEPEFWATLGGKLREYTVVAITPDYSYRLAYWGWMQPTNWMSEGDFGLRELAGQDIDRQAQLLNAVGHKDLFLVTDFAEFDRQTAVKDLLINNFSVWDEGEGYIIFDLRNP